ncbi:hypothetical protein NBRC116601_01990 [Cognatishimia sp. WU-CL00825]|uniref:EF-hand domain-containing protein n=1 Tax=Cognatishimia sp. WU-CL00825 TaxID=3127658 RepID=UPI0031079F8C
MKRAVLISSVTVVALALGAATVSAKGMGGKHGQQGPRFNFEEVDANADGKITLEEMAAHAQSRFAAVDTDGDGNLSADELQAAKENARGERTQRMIEHRDTNDDGMLSFEEMQPKDDRAAKMFERLDADGDGALSEEELAKMKGKHKGKRKGGKRGEDKSSN